MLREYRSSAFLFCLVASIAFVLQPFWCVVSLAVYGCTRSFLPLWYIRLFTVLGSTYLGLINVTKLPESDLVNYFEAFADAKDTSFVNFLAIYAREPLYYSMMYVFANIPGGSERLYILLSTLVPYFMLLASLLLVCETLRIPRRVTLSWAMLTLFFPQLFSLSAHVMRQFLAAAFVAVFLSQVVCRSRNRWWIGFLGAMMHFSALPLLVVSQIGRFRRLSGGINILIFLVAVLAIYLAARVVAPVMVDAPVVGSIFWRVLSNEGHTLDPVSGIALAISALLFMVSLSRVVAPGLVGALPGEIKLSIATFVVSALVLFSALVPTLTELATRYFFYLYFLGALFLPILVERVRFGHEAVILASLLSIPVFFTLVASGTWHYAGVMELISYPGWSLWEYSR
jgi:hypothetical protein